MASRSGERLSEIERKANVALLLEKCWQNTVKSFNDNLKWANAGIFSLAIEASITSLLTFSDLAREWIIGSSLIVAVIALKFLFQSVQSVDQIKKNLNIDESYKYRARSKIFTAYLRDLSRFQSELGGLEQLHEHDADPPQQDALQWAGQDQWTLTAAMQRLVIGALSVMAAQILNLAFEGAYAEYVQDHIANAFLRKLTFSLIITCINVYLAVKCARLFANAKRNINEKVQMYPLRQLRCSLLWFTKIKQLIEVLEFVFSLLTAWSWGATCKEFIEHATGENLSELVKYWLCTAWFTFFLSLGLALSDKYFWLYPKDRSQRRAYEESVVRSVTNEALYNSFRFTVGIFWFQSISESIRRFIDTFLSMGDVSIITYWLCVVLTILFSAVMDHYYHKWHLRNKIQEFGLLHFLNPAAEADDEEENENDEVSEDEPLLQYGYVPQVRYFHEIDGVEENAPDIYLFVPIIALTVAQLFEQSIFAIGLSGAFSIRLAVEETILWGLKQDMLLIPTFGRNRVLWIMAGLVSLISSVTLILLNCQVRFNRRQRELLQGEMLRRVESQLRSQREIPLRVRYFTDFGVDVKTKVLQRVSHSLRITRETPYDAQMSRLPTQLKIEYNFRYPQQLMSRSAMYRSLQSEKHAERAPVLEERNHETENEAPREPEAEKMNVRHTA